MWKISSYYSRTSSQSFEHGTRTPSAICYKWWQQCDPFTAQDSGDPRESKVSEVNDEIGTTVQELPNTARRRDARVWKWQTRPPRQEEDGGPDHALVLLAKNMYRRPTEAQDKRSKACAATKTSKPMPATKLNCQPKTCRREKTTR